MIELICKIDWKWCVIIEKIKFKHALFGGYSKLSVYRQLNALNREYQVLFENEYMKYEAILEEKEREVNLLKENGEFKKR